MIAAVIGAGGKTTVCTTLAIYLTKSGQKVLFTTTTKIRMPEKGPVYIGSPSGILPTAGNFLTAGSEEIEGCKLKGYTPPEIEQISSLGLFDSIIVEGDGAKGKPVKAPGESEPVYPKNCNVIIGVIGLDSLGKPITEQTVHRSGLFSDIVQAKEGDVITTEHLSRLINHPDGLFKNAPAVPKIVFLNKMDLISSGYKADAKALMQLKNCPVLLTQDDDEWLDDFFNWYHPSVKGNNKING